MKAVESQVKGIIKDLEGKSSLEVLQYIAKTFGDKAVFSSSLGLEDQVITHLIFSHDLPIRVFTLDTGRLFPETYKTLNSTVNRYKKQIEVYYPETAKIQSLVTEKRPFSFYNSVEDRKECCFVRKVEPLKRALSGNQCWVTGIRASQGQTRKDMHIAEWDEGNSIIKIHPLINWDLDEVWAFIKANHIPYNPLHNKGFPSIGCQPCTRAIRDGEDIRAGRWWWENPDSKECGLHE